MSLDLQQWDEFSRGERWIYRGCAVGLLIVVLIYLWSRP